MLVADHINARLPRHHAGEPSFPHSPSRKPRAALAQKWWIGFDPASRAGPGIAASSPVPAMPPHRRGLVRDLLPTRQLPGDCEMDAAEYLDILEEAVEVRNGLKRILARCGPRCRRDRP